MQRVTYRPIGFRSWSKGTRGSRKRSLLRPRLLFCFARDYFEAGRLFVDKFEERLSAIPLSLRTKKCCIIRKHEGSSDCIAPSSFVKTCSIIEGDRQQPGIRVNSHKSQPVLSLQADSWFRPMVLVEFAVADVSTLGAIPHLHSVSSEVYAQAGLRHLGRHFFGR